MRNKNETTNQGRREMTSHKLARTMQGLDRIRIRMHEVETATDRKRTPGREHSIMKGDDLSGWHQYDLACAGACGVNLSEAASSARTQIDAMIEGWAR